jgi:hypothetical protein
MENMMEFRQNHPDITAEEMAFIPAYMRFDIGVVASHILNLPHKQIRLEYKNPDFWKHDSLLIGSHSGGGLGEENSTGRSGQTGMELVS